MGRAGAIVLVVPAIASPSTGSAQQRLYKWTDENGDVHYSETIPPDFTTRPPPIYGEPFGSQDHRDRRLELLESQIKLAELYVVDLHKRLADLQANASNFKPYSTREDAAPI